MTTSRRRAPESTGVGEQEFTRYDDATRVHIAAHRARAARNLGVNRVAQGLGELPALLRAESLPTRQVLNPDEGAVPDWLNQYTQSNFPFTIGVTSERILPANPFRTYLLVQNKSADFIFLNFGQVATNYNGIRIAPGGNYELIGGATGGAHCPGDDVYVIGNAAALDGVATEGVWVDVAE